MLPLDDFEFFKKVLRERRKQVARSIASPELRSMVSRGNAAEMCEAAYKTGMHDLLKELIDIKNAES